MGATARWRREIAAHPLISDVALAAALYLTNLVQPGQTSHGGEQVPLTWPGALLSLVACGALMLRRPFPVPVLAVTVAASLAHVVIVGAKSPIGLTIAAAAYSVVVTATNRRTWVAICSATAVVVAAGAIAFADGGVLENLGIVVLVLLGVAVGEAVRNRRAYIAEVEERARRAEQSREEEAHRRVIEERLRIAHELHDVIAHHIALMNVQAGVAAHVLRERPDEAERALAHVRDGGRTVLAELTVLLGVLRESGESPTPTEPIPSMRRLGELVDSFAAAGLDVEWRPDGVPGSLPATVDLTAYRIVQESLTNVFKHAPGAHVTVQVEEVDGKLRIDVCDNGDGGRSNVANGTGHGLIGMRERVTAVGGELRAGPRPDGGFQVTAALPVGGEA